ncbi:deoxynucleoside kinase [Sporosarcina sp. GW1-11]|uniref:deoxynucleoside kinase n=1 Tax=Sporosarcina sp. GW1-11 TaxID=2899126 RepID=UPI00294C1FD0|nr:deoxynucleoside kinase [Sporosarcina sp. GW1-11]MDV6379418.1 deoxynucleoside kinase [Sporosarcina sp. GW1-11]
MKSHNIRTNSVFAVAGMVGVGKSTMTNAVASRLGFQASFENVAKNPYLEKFYTDFERWSFHLQIFFLAERFKEQKRIVENGGGFVQDRSIYEDVGIFAKMHADEGTMDAVDYETYMNLYEAMVMTPYFPHPNALIYLEGSLESILERIEERGRNMELQTPRSYWEEMYRRYEEWINSFTACPVIRLNINDYDLLSNEEDIDQIIEKLAAVMQKETASRK